MKIQSEEFDVDLEIDIDHGMAVKFDRAALRLGFADGADVPRENWGLVVKAAIEAGYIPDLGPVDKIKPPKKVEWLAAQIALAHNQATGITPK